MLLGLDGLTSPLAALWTLASTSGYSQELDDRKIKEPFFFGTHPRLEERIGNFRRLLESNYAIQAKDEARTINAQEFLSRISQLLLDNANLDINLGRLKTARASVDRHRTLHPQAARAHFLLGEIHRRSGSDEAHTAQAMAAYREATRQDARYAEPHRELGILYRARGSRLEARTAFERYLALNPAATDAPIIEGYLKEL